MKAKASHRALPCALAVILLALLLPALARPVHAKATTSVKYEAEEDTYYLCDSSKNPVTVAGPYYLSTTANNKKFSGIYYVSAEGKISTTAGVWYIEAKKLNGKEYGAGFYYFADGGKMSTSRTCRKLSLTCGENTYEGCYCFAGTDGKMIVKPGLVTMDRNVYYYVVDETGKCLAGEKLTENGFTYSFDDNGVGKRTNTKLSSLEKKLKKKIKGYSGTWSIYVKRLDNNDSLTINNKSLYAASLIKVYVMASLYNQIKNGTIKNSSKLKSLTKAMITVSDNDACNELVKRQTKSHSFSKGRKAINKYISNNKYTKTSIHHTLHPSSHVYATDGKSNVTSVKDCGALLESIYRGTCVNKTYSKQMLKYLLAQKRRWKIPAGVPSKTKVANKTGETSTSDHDIAIVYSPKCTYILCVMSKNAGSSSSRIKSISKTVYNYFN